MSETIQRIQPTQSEMRLGRLDTPSSLRRYRRTALSSQSNGSTPGRRPHSRRLKIVRRRLAGAPVGDNIVGDLLAFV
jgi:hypothetical protein